MRKWWLLILAGAVSLAYFLFNRPIGTVHVLAVGWDAHLPVWPILGIPYLLFIPILWLTVLWAFWRNHHSEALAWSIIVIHLVAFTIYVLYQSQVLRPMVDLHALGSAILTFIYRNDRQYAAFPSLHTASATVLAIYFYRIHSRYWWLMAVFCVVVICSTVLLKQHYLVDVLGGLILGGVTSYYLFFRQNFATLK